jgi:hypothetical protein
MSWFLRSESVRSWMMSCVRLKGGSGRYCRVGCRRSAGWQRGVAVTGPSSGLHRCLNPQPQPVSYILLYHPGRRDFPGPVGSENISSWGLPDARAV